MDDGDYQLDCSDVPEGHTEAGPDCEPFYFRCEAGGVARRLSCPDGHFFSAGLAECVPGRPACAQEPNRDQRTTAPSPGECPA